jgi:dTDP-4-amino-4,6-dideoxygalactose transaminase
LAKFGLDSQPRLPVSEDLARSGFYIPNGLGMGDDDVQFVIENVRLVLK